MQQYQSAKNIPVRDRLIFALDVPDTAAAKKLVKTLGDAVTFYKCGMDLFMADDYFGLINWLMGQGKKVFVDLKFFDVPNTVKAAVRNLAGRGVTFTTVHGNDAMLKAAAEAKGDSLKVLGVTVLTSLDRGDLDDLGFQCEVDALVLSRAKRALACGCDGVISSGLEVPKLRAQLDHKLLVVSPGIRPVENKPVDDQKRTVDVRQAFLNGADYIVVGRPIKEAADPHRQAEEIQATIAALFHR
jgi:orotidine-5'-phosphate decarboxylase